MTRTERATALFGGFAVASCIAAVLWSSASAPSAVDLPADAREAVPLDAPRTDIDVPERALPISKTIGSENSFGGIYEVQTNGDLALLIDRLPLRDEMMILAVDLVTGEVTNRGGRKGFGPGEIMDSLAIDLMPFRPDQFSVYDSVNKRLTVFRHTPWSAEPVEQFTHDDGASLASVLWLDEHRAIGSGVIRAPHVLRLYTVDRSSARLRLERDIGSSMFPGSPDADQGRLNRNLIGVRPDGTRVAVAYVNASRVEVYESNGDLLTRVATPEEIRVAVSRGRRARGTAYAYQDLAVSQDHIYGLFSGLDGDQPYYVDKVQVFSWDGDLEEILALEQPVAFIAASSDDRQLIGVRNDPYPHLLVYDLSKP